MWALKEETDGIFLSYTVVQGTPSVCDALAKSRNEFYQAPQSPKVVLHWPPLKQGPRQNLQYTRTTLPLLEAEVVKLATVEADLYFYTFGETVIGTKPNKEELK